MSVIKCDAVASWQTTNVDAPRTALVKTNHMLLKSTEDS